MAEVYARTSHFDMMGREHVKERESYRDSNEALNYLIMLGPERGHAMQCSMVRGCMICEIRAMALASVVLPSLSIS